MIDGRDFLNLFPAVNKKPVVFASSEEVLIFSPTHSSMKEKRMGDDKRKRENPPLRVPKVNSLRVDRFWGEGRERENCIN